MRTTRGQSQEEVQRGTARLAKRIREARSGRYTVAELAAVSGVSTGLISQVERGRANPTFGTLVRLAAALDIPLGDFFEGPVTGDDVVRSGGRRRIEMPEGLVYELLSPDLQHNLAMMMTVVPPGFDNAGSPRVHAGDECVHVLKGVLEVHYGGKTARLETGDTVTYDSGLPHSWKNPSKTETIVIGGFAPPTF